MANGVFVSSKFQQCLECMRGKVCNGEVLRRIPTACKWGRPAGLPARIHRWTMCQGNLTHTDQRPHSRPAVRGNGTERDDEEREKELITAIMLHFIIVSWACLITLTVSVVYTAPPSPIFSYASFDLSTLSLPLRGVGAQVAWLVYRRDSQSTTWKLVILEGDSSGHQKGENLDWPWLSCIRYVCRAKCFLCFFMHAYLTLLLWGRLFIFAKAHM